LSAEPSDRDVAIPKLLEAHGNQIYGLGLRMCGSPEAAEELVQETFLQAFRKWAQFQGRSKASTWLYTIASRLCQRRQRRRAGEPARFDSFDELLAKYRDLPGSDDDPLQDLLRKEEQEVAAAAIARTPARFRLPLLLKELAHLSIADIAAALGVQETTVKTRIHRARLFLATELAKLRGSRPRDVKPSHSRQACIELLDAKQNAIDRGVAWNVSDQELCERCRMLFQALDWASDSCRRLEESSLSDSAKVRTKRAVDEMPL